MLVAPALTGFLSDRSVAIEMEAIEFLSIGPNDPATGGVIELASLEKTLA